MKSLPVKQWLQDFSLSATVAGILITLVGVTSSAVMVYQAALAAGATSTEAASWLGSLALALGILSLVLSLKYRAPVLIAWSTAGAAMIITGMQGISINQAAGAFMFSAALIFLSGVTGLFEKVMNKIPVALASGLLAGVLMHFAIDSFAAFKNQPALIGAMFVTYVLGKKFFPRMTMMAVLLVGIVVAQILGILQLDQIQMTPTPFHFTTPEFSWAAILNLGIPLFIVTMASQNLTGVTTMRTFGFTTPISPLLTWTGIANFVIAPFGGFTLNLAAITAAIGMSPEAHPQKSRRYIAGAVSGILYIFLGLFAGVITSLFAAFPKEMILAVTGLALLGTIASSLQQTLANEKQREAAFICFAITASGLTLFGIGSAFWGLLVGALTQLILTSRKPV